MSRFFLNSKHKNISKYHKMPFMGHLLWKNEEVVAGRSKYIDGTDVVQRPAAVYPSLCIQPVKYLMPASLKVSFPWSPSLTHGDHIRWDDYMSQGSDALFKTKPAHTQRTSPQDSSHYVTSTVHLSLSETGAYSICRPFLWRHLLMMANSPTLAANRQL